MDLVRLAYYPFLPGVREAVRELGPDIPTLLSSNLHAGVRRRAMDRLRAALDQKPIEAIPVRNDRDALAEIMSLPVARMLAVLLGDRSLIHRYAAAEGARLEATLKQDPGSLAEVADSVGLQVSRDDGWRMHFADYLTVAPLWEDDWKLIQQPLARGWLPLTDAQMAALCRHALTQRIRTELEAELERPVHDEIRAPLQEYLDVLGPLLAEARKDWNTGDFGPVQDTLFPPCIQGIFQDMADGKMVTHHARFAIASFLATIGMTAEDIQTYFSTIPNFDPEKSRYQITHIAGEQGVDKYTPPGCGTMQTNGVCPLEKRDNLCFKIKHPLSYYRARIRFQQEDEKKAGEKLEHERRKQEALAANERSLKEAQRA